MPAWDAVRWDELFSFSVPVMEILVRGSVMYLMLFTLLRTVFRRETGTISMSDLLVIVIIADASQNAIAGEYTSIPDGMLLVLTIMFWSFTLDWLAFHYPVIARFVHPAPLPLIKDGKMMRHNLRKELITLEELESQLREQGVDDIAKVRKACLEGDGRISVIPYESNEKNQVPEPNIH